ncbi:MAG TPA: hypothetical protein VJ801_01620, partial [Polyangia bacterium]|nr:hypothetical protein [Polyangia bacterium]
DAPPAPEPPPPAATTPAPAPPPPPGYPPPGSGPSPAYPPQAGIVPPGYHTHDGFYARFAVGGGGLSGSAGAQKYSGGSGAYSLAGGTAIAESLILYAELLGYDSLKPRFEGNGGWDATSVHTAGLGPGVAYYFMPLNLYVSGTLLYQVWASKGFRRTANAASPAPVDPSGWAGIGCSLMVGKEWWVSANWGLGVAAQLLLGESTGSPADGHWTAKALAIMFSSTYN